MASFQDDQLKEWLRNSQHDVTSSDSKSVQDFKQLLASHIEKSDIIILKVKDLEDELKVAQSELDRAAMNSKQIKEELTKQCKEHHEIIKQCLEKEIHKCHDEMRKAEVDLAKKIASAEENFIASVEPLLANQDNEVQATEEMTEDIENIKEDYIKKFATLEENVKAINREMKRNQEDVKVVKEEFRPLQARVIATEEKLLSIENRAIMKVLIICMIIINFALIALIAA